MIQSQVEEIDDIEDSSVDPFVADAIANERELNLSEEQKRKYKKVCEWYILVLFFDIDTSFLEDMEPDEVFIHLFSPFLFTTLSFSFKHPLNDHLFLLQILC